MVDDLLESGRTYKELAEKAGCDTSTIYRIKTGFIANPKFSIGMAIGAMHAELKAAA